MSNKTANDLTTPANLSEHEQGTGPLRRRRPEYVDLLPPCNQACPAGENIQAWLSHFQAGDYQFAWQRLIEENPMPAIHGRVCYHPCETACNRDVLDESVSIHAVERYLGDLALKEQWIIPKAEATGKRILIVGAGPSGLSAAYHLARFGHDVEIRDAGPIAGGMMRFGIPAYRLPREVLNAEIQRIVSVGVKITLNHKVADLLAEKSSGNFDAVFVAVGAHLSKRVDIPAREAGPIIDAVSFLREAASNSQLKIGRRVAIYGGGNTAMDAARTAKRLGAEEALIIYRRDRDHMPAHQSEADESLDEGVKINWLRTIKSFDDTKLTVEVMKIGDDGRPQATGETESLEADSLILALGQNTDTAFMENIPGIEFDQDSTVQVDTKMMTGFEGIFAGGDMVPSDRTVTTGVGHGKKAARQINAWLNKRTLDTPSKHSVVGFERLHVWFRTQADKQDQSVKPAETRTYDFSEILGGLSEKEALYEAQRCLSCGNCFECDGCFGACPENAIIKLGKGLRYRFNFDRCTGCAICFEQCPCHAIEMILETGETA